MARYNSIWMGPSQKNRPQTVEGTVSAASKPGTIVRRGAAANTLTVGAAVAGDGGMFYILDEGYLDGLGQDLDTVVSTDTTSEAFYLFSEVNYCALLAAGENVTALDTPLYVNTSGELQVVDASQTPVLYANEVYNNTTGESQLIKVRKA